MNRQELELKTIFNMARWEKLQDAMSRTLGVAIAVADYKGTVVSRISGCADFCAAVRGTEYGCRLCSKCVALAGLEAVRTDMPHLFLCHAGVGVGAVPLMLGDRFLGSVLVGQVLISSSLKPKRLINEVSGSETDLSAVPLTMEELRELHHRLPEMDYQKLYDICQLIKALIDYMIDNSVQAQAELRSYEWMLRYAVPSLLGKDDSRHGELDAMMSEEPADSASGTQNAQVSPTSPIFPAVHFVNSHRKVMVSMKDMAKLCHLSPSYFSKLFFRETGKNFTDWLISLKVDWAKDMLRDSGDSINSIAAQLGYADASYFIKVFKRIAGVTPLAYRQHRVK